ncbi:hypothetical protein THRCLA_09485 [Thraustotheca clavata]|uniref:Fibronectin type-III domain-containing protein n=1 Tax=Thraustotheca clavata TaxID=74557 RepID=A0A1V9YWE2_9STRA|nr:hypothetical protein THRCLA_09485 [Thraustotheca clavata]
MLVFFLVGVAWAKSTLDDVARTSVQDELYRDAAVEIAENDHAPIDHGLNFGTMTVEECKSLGYSHVNAYTLSDSQLNAQVLEHCNYLRYQQLVNQAVDDTRGLKNEYGHFWRAMNETLYQDFFQKHILMSHPALIPDRMELSANLLAKCFAQDYIQTEDAACREELESFSVPQCLVNDYMQRVDKSLELDTLANKLAPVRLSSESLQLPTHCPYGFHMVLAAINPTTVILKPHLPTTLEYTFPLDTFESTEDVFEASIDADGNLFNSNGGNQLPLQPGDLAFIPSGYSVTASTSMLRFCFADASNFNRIKRHLRVGGLIDREARALLLAFQAPTFNTKMVRRVDPEMSGWSVFTSWPKPDRITKESDLDSKKEAVSRRERYKIWQEDRKWDDLVHSLTLPVTRPPIVVLETDIGRTFVHLTWQDLYQGRKGDITSYGYEVSWNSESNSLQNGHCNISSSQLIRSALPTAHFGGDFDGQAIQGKINNLEANTSYTFTVRLFVGDTFGLQSERSKVITTKSSSVPDVIPGLPKPELNDAANCIQLTWLPALDDGGRDILGYAVGARFLPATNDTGLQWLPFNWSCQYDVLQNNAILIAKHDVALTTKNMTGNVCNLRSGFSYQFQVAAINEIGAGGFSVWSDVITIDASLNPERRDVVRGFGAPNFHRKFNPENLGRDIRSVEVTDGPVLVFSDTQQIVQPYQFISPATISPQRDTNNRVIWSTWGANVWSGHHSSKAYDIIAEAALADPVQANSSLVNNVHDRIAIVYRGGVPFYTKVFHAQAAGAIAVLIVDINNLCADGFDEHCCPGSSQVMGEGLGAKDEPSLWQNKIRIPYALLRQEDALPLLQKLQVNIG